MKLNRSFFINTALTITLLISTTLSARGKEITNYAQNHNSETHGEVISGAVENYARKEYKAESLNQEFSLKQTIEIEKELAFALLIILVCQLVKYSSKSVARATPGVFNKPENRYMVVGLGHFYHSINGHRGAREYSKEKVESKKKLKN